MKLLTLGLLMTQLFASAQEPLHFVDCKDPILDDVARPLSLQEIHDPAMQRLFDAMMALAKGEQGDQRKHVLVGLAAPQIGKSLRVILVDVTADGKGGVSEPKLYINPEILETSEETEEWYEGCYSTGDVKGIVRRPSRVKIQALDRDGSTVVETHTGYVARIFQHEIDHLNGIRFPDRVSDEERLHIVKTHEMPAYRNQLGWRTWKATIPKKGWKDHTGTP